ncbi:hypothetical protein BDV26DRAFT_302790 [Aspergillus bertholletiae]|uniref:Transferase family-domain-containing protein n=1 Tax=Aspergillus bertholletiae TaxID=1226010 RepID=A0A5N7ANF9_9EURO|nr:hypothetical protein BDV26DRAFT_302790 [Aspergillus bertholletiae]
MGIFSKKRARPQRVATDTVIPLSWTDSQSPLRGISLNLTWRFDEVLDPEVLRLSLGRLLELDGWHKLGARLRSNDHGGLEYHVPAEYNATRPGVDFTVSGYVMSISDHTLASRFPQASSQPALLGSPMDLLPVCTGPQSPWRIEDWLYTDRPQLAIHVVSFDDATLVTVTWLHTLTDMMGLSGFCKAWTAILNGREEEVPKFHGIGDTALDQIGQDATGEPYVNSKYLLTGFKYVMFAFLFLLELIWHWNTETRIMCIPGRYVENMRTEALEELGYQNEKECSLFVSESDVLLAWWVKAQTKVLSPFRNRMIGLMNVFDIRSTVLPGSASGNRCFVGNAVQSSITFTRAHQVLDQPVSALAFQVRQSLVQQRTKPQVEAERALQKTYFAKTGRRPCFAVPNGLLVPCSNWQKAKLFEVDFSSAVVAKERRGTDRANRCGNPSSINGVPLAQGFQLRFLTNIYGQDLSGNWWLTCTLRRKAWPAIEEELKALGAMDRH